MPGNDHARLEPAEAFRRAVESLTSGHFDSRSETGAIANALESIAWSFIGIFGNGNGMHSAHQEQLSDALDKLGLISIEK